MYSAGSAALQIIPSFKGVAEAINAQAEKWGVSAAPKFANSFADGVATRLRGMNLGPSDSDTVKQGSKSGGKFADGFRAKVTAALQQLPDIEVDANTSDADFKIAELRQRLLELSNKRVGIDIDETEALAEIDRIKTDLDELGRKSPSVRVQADTAAASAKLAELQAEIAAVGSEDAQVNVDDGGSISGVEGGLVGLSSLLIGLVPLIAPIGAALAAAFAGVGATLGALAGAAGVAVLGFSGVSKAVGLLDQQQKASASSGGAAVSSMGQQAAAAQQLKQAQLSLKQARQNADDAAITSAERVKQARQSLAQAEQQAAQQQVQAARAVQQAEYSLAQAAQNSATAQQALNDAREQAARDLESYANNAVDSNLNVQQSQIDLTNAQAQYQSDLANPTVTPVQLQQDALNVAKAQQAIIEAQERLQQATEDNNKAQAEGVNGAPGVVSAAQSLAQAQHAELQAVQALADAQKAQAQQAVTSARQTVNAQQGLSDALREQTKQQRQSAYSIEQAQAGIATAMRAVQAASVSAGGAGSSALSWINEQLAKVNPATLQFAHYVQNTLKPALSKLQGAAAGGLLPGIEAGFNAFLPILPILTRFVGSLARTMGDLFEQAVKALGSPVWQRFFAYVASSAGPILSTFAKIVGNIATGFAGLFTAFGPVTTAIGAAVGRVAKSFADFGSGGTGALQSFLTYVRQVGPTVADLFGNLAIVVGKLVVALAPLGAVMVKVIDAIVSFLAKLSPNQMLAVAVAISAITIAFGVLLVATTPLTAVPALAASIGVAVTAAAGLIVANWSKIQPVVQPVLNLFAEVGNYVRDTLVPVLVGVFHDALAGVVAAFHTVSDAVSGHRDQLNQLKDVFAALVDFITTKVVPVLGPVLKGFFELAGQEIRGLIDIVAGLVEGLDGMITAGKKVGEWFSGPFVKFFKTVGKDISKALGGVADAAVSVWDNVQNAFVTGINFVTQDILNPFIRAINSVLGIFGVHVGTIGKITVSKAPAQGPGSRGGGQNAPKAFARGGVAPGYSPGNDTLLARVSPGEGFIVPEAVRGLGGPAAIHAINATYSSRIPGFSLGGVLGGIGGAIGGAVSSVTGKARKLAAEAALKVLDVLEVPIRAALSLAPSGFGRTLGGGLLDSVNSGVHNYIAGKTFDNGGYLPPGLTAVWNGTGAPEPVFTASQAAQLAAGSGAAQFEGNLYLDSGEFLGRVRGEAHDVVTQRATAAHRQQQARWAGTSAALMAKDGPR